MSMDLAEWNDRRDGLAAETVERCNRRVAVFAAKYAPILQRLSETEFTGLTSAVVAEAHRRESESKRLLVIENTPGLIGKSLRAMQERRSA